MTHTTINGTVEIRRRVYGSKSHGWQVPLDRFLGIEQYNVSVGVRERCCLEALDSSFANVVRSLQTLGQIHLSEDRVRRIVESEGARVQAVHRTNQLGTAFTASDCSDGILVTGTDGVFVPTVPETQKQKRRQTEAKKRLTERRRSTGRPGRPKKGTDGVYKEAKVLTFYSQDKKHLHVVTTLKNSKAMGGMMRREARKVKLDQAKFSYSVADGAKWIQREYRRNLPMIDAHILDWYHFQDHVVQTSHVVYGETSVKARHWQKKMLEAAWEQGSLVMLHKLAPYERSHTGENRKALGHLRRYTEKRIPMTDYPSFRQMGYDCGSGPTESQCGTLTARVKGPGMRWDGDNAAGMLALAALDHSRLWKPYWNLQKTA